MVAGNNAIDPAPLVDGSNQWLTWGNWQTGIDLLQLNTSTGKPLNSSRWDLVPGQVEAPYLHKDGSFYYLFFQRGLCCQGVNSGYYTMVARSTSVTGPYLDKNGVNVLTGGSLRAASSCRIATAATSARVTSATAKAGSRITSTTATTTARRS